MLGWFLGGGGGGLGFSQPPYLTQQSVASWLVAGGPSVAQGALPVVGVGRLGSRTPSRRLHCVSSPAAPPPPCPSGWKMGRWILPRLAVSLRSSWPRPSEQGGEHVSLDPRARGTNRPGCPGMSLPLARPGMAGGCWKRASRIWLELGLTHISKPDHSPSPFPGLGWPCLLTRSAE